VDQQQAAELGYRKGIFHPLLAVVGPADDVKGRAVGVAFVMALHRHHLHRLVLEGIEAVLVADENLHGRRQRRHPHRH
jgi:hypothetical protein